MSDLENESHAGGPRGRVRIVAEAAAVVIFVAMFGWAALGWGSAPERFPMHFDLHGQVDRYGGRVEGMLAIPLIALAIYLLLLFLPRIDPGKANYANMAGPYAVIRLSIVAFFGAVHLLIQTAAHGRAVDLTNVLPFGLGVLFLVLGNVLGKLRPNWFVGIRTPWTLSSAESWSRTHRAGGWVFVATGLVTLVASVTAGRAAFPIAVGLLLLGTLGLVIYSYVVWRDDPNKVPPAGRTAA
ncbi:MAG TPA: SdpI family protein [Candidatus Polarisedimenticolia bacterium]|nr:SdpI family protein [Candidatus Polarisedimenticolia bacterium]